jgi:hypothetical protein
MVTVYRKSAKGQLEIETRVNRLHPRLRTVLILVDGRRNDDELRSLIQVDADATLLALIEGGYIEVSAGAAPAGASPSPPAQAPVAGQARAAAPASAAPAMAAPAVAAPAAAAPGGASPAGLAERRRLAVRHLTDRLGPVAEPVSLRIEKARTWDEQRAALELGQRLLQTARGSSAAAEFASLFLHAPPG